MELKNMKNTVLTILSILSLASCARRESGPPAPPVWAAPAGDSERLTLAERLTREAQSRPAGALRAEQVAVALEQAGIDLRPMQQVLARTVGARFCMSAQTGGGMGVAVCEFSDDAEAARGLEYSRRTFDNLIPHRRLVRNRSTVLTLTRAQPTAALNDQAARAAQTFASL